MTEAQALEQARRILRYRQRLYCVEEGRTRGGTSFIHSYCIVTRLHNGEQGAYATSELWCLDYLVAPLLHLERSCDYHEAIIMSGPDLGRDLVQRLSIAVFGDAQALQQQWL